MIEKIGVERALENASDADLIIYVVDASRPLDDNDLKIIDYIYARKTIILLNKNDLKMKIMQEYLQKIIKERHEIIESNQKNNNRNKNISIISISAKEEKGLDQFGNLLKEMFFNGELHFNDEIYITNLRQKDALQRAYESLKKVKESIEMGMPEDFYSIDLMDAYESLGEITGETIGEDLVNEIFSKFCMGK